jgi:hypothetical protein
MSPSPAAQAVRSRLGAALGVRHTKADIALGQDIATRSDAVAMAGLVELLDEPAMASSAIKAIYECGYLAPALLVPHLPVFRALLDGVNNRMVWGGMIAIAGVAKADPVAVWSHRERLELALREGTVITKMSAVHALTAVAGSDPAKATALQGWFEEAFETLDAKQLLGAAELILPVAADRGPLVSCLVERGDQLATATARKRLQRLVKRYGT